MTADTPRSKEYTRADGMTYTIREMWYLDNLDLVPFSLYPDAVKEFRDNNRKNLQWWQNFCVDMTKISDISFAKILDYDTRNEDKLKTLACWQCNEELMYRLENYYLY